MNRTLRPNKKKPASPPPSEPVVDNTGTLLIRAARSIEKFDAQLEESKTVARDVRGRLDGRGTSEARRSGRRRA